MKAGITGNSKNSNNDKAKDFRTSIIKLINILFYPAIIIIMAIIAQIIFNN